MYLRDKGRTDLHLLQRRFVIGWESNRYGDITMPLSLKTIGSAGYRDQWNKSFGCVQVNRKGKRQRTLNAGDLLRQVQNVELFIGQTKLGELSS